MARGTKLSDALVMLKSELGISTAPSTGHGSDSELMSIIDTQQKWLAGEFDWPFLRSQEDVQMFYGDRYGLLPEKVDFEKPVRVDAWSAGHDWHQLEFGITAEQYNQLSSVDLGGIVPDYMLNVSRWDIRPWRPDRPEINPPPPKPLSVFEIWPLSSVDHVIRFTGKRPLTPLRASGGFVLNAPLELDDILVVFYAAYKKLSRSKKEDASFVLAQAEKRFNSLRAAQPSRETPIILGGQPRYYRHRNIIAGNAILTV